MIDWRDIDVVLLDMDGVLLDLRFDNWFWNEHVPERYAAKQALSVEQAKSRVRPWMESARGSLNWYCVDYWSRTLDLDIVQLKIGSAHRIRLRPGVVEFLTALKARAGTVHLVTNAHRRTMEVKFAQVGLDRYFEEIVCSHDYGSPKEDLGFWQKSYRRPGFDAGRALLIDDNLEVLRAARRFGVGRLLAVRRPDSAQPRMDTAEFDAIDSFADIMPG